MSGESKKSFFISEKSIIATAFFLSFILAFSILSGLLASGVTAVTVSTEKNAYVSGETVVVSGTVSEVVAGQEVNVTITNPIGQRWGTAALLPDANGNFKAPIGTVSQLDTTGTYTVRAKYGDGSATTQFHVRSTPQVTVRTDRSVYKIDETITVLGEVSPYLSGYAVSIYLNYSSTIKAVAQTFPLSNGSFTVRNIHTVSKGDRGNWTVIASYGNLAQAKHLFYVGVYVNAQTASTVIEPGKAVVVAGSVSVVVTGPVKVRITNPDGAVWAEIDVNPQVSNPFAPPYGSFSANQTVYPWDLPGTYQVTVSYLGATNNTSFRVTNYGSNLFSITEAGTYDTQGKRERVFQRGWGMDVVFTVKNQDKDTHSYVYLVQFKSIAGKVVFIASASSTLTSGASSKWTVSPPLTNFTPDKYTLSIFVWDDLNIATPLAEPVTLSFEVF